MGGFVKISLERGVDGGELVQVGVFVAQLDDMREGVWVGGVVGVADYIAGIEFGFIFENGGFELAEFFQLVGVSYVPGIPDAI